MKVQSRGQEDLPEKEMATHSSIFGWEIPRTEEPGGLKSIRLHRAEHDLALTHTHIICYILYIYLLSLFIFMLR